MQLGRATIFRVVLSVSSAYMRLFIYVSIYVVLCSFCHCYNALLLGGQVSKFARERSASVVSERTSNAVAVDRSHSVLLKRHHRVNVSYLKNDLNDL